jgi:AraC-like DNA-binding protein
MGLFDDIEWAGYISWPTCRAWVDKVFPDYWVLDYNHSGEIPLQIDDGPTIKLTGPVAWFTFPGPRFRFGSRDHSWHHNHLSFRGRRVQHYLDSELIAFDPTHPVFPISDSQRFLRSFTDLIDYLDSPTYGHARSVHMLEGLLLQLNEQRDISVPVHPSADGIRDLIDLIGENPAKVYEFKKLASDMGISYTHFRRLFTQLSGYSPQQLVARKRIARACQMLRGDDEIKVIADELGYSDAYHFNKQFKLITGLPPGRYRTRNREW